jgi:NTP pyrophosphatase (non-canonical NTP hydrolase)
MEKPEWSLNVDELAEQIARWREAKGFKTPDGIDTPEKRTQMMEKLMLVVTELGEAAEAVRHQNSGNFWEEMADAMIRILDISGTCGVSILAEMHAKMDINFGRPHKHGKEL